MACAELAADPIRALELLREGGLTVHGRLTTASNAAFYCSVDADGVEAFCVYKPVAGERPLWDFPDGTLAARETAAYEVAAAAGWPLIPPTVLREGPFGEGMVQLWIEPVETPELDTPDPGAADAADAEGAPGAEAADGAGTGRADEEDGGPHALLALQDAQEPEPGWRAIGRAEVGGGRTALLVHADDQRLRRLSVLDAVINNGDRKGGHLLTAADGRLYGIDHGVTFAVPPKLRTLLWGWAGEPLTGEAVEVLGRLDGELAEGAALDRRLAALLTAEELTALRGRVTGLLESGVHPLPSGDWPAVPWPPI
ncbi:SCO1664 family protein [Phaeacidiphilus oryzae]|uniref:SCO1664 family protein n=1 Tax=Phaeacidiphilus oryzae TaxID=348818 RepID=UPI000A61C690|nr:SCO1664 family protein [Phaeacidiphilus oryzae]